MEDKSNNLCEFLEWDSTFFGYRIARVNTRKLDHTQAKIVDNWANENKIDCLYYLADYESDIVRVAEDFNYRLQDTRITLAMPLPHNEYVSRVPDTYKLGIATKDDTAILLTMIDELFIYTRFYTDPNFTAEQCDELYRVWLKRSIEEDYSDRVFVYRKDNIAQAFLICNLDIREKNGNMTLLGVTKSGRGNDLGRSLVSAGLDYFVKENMTKTDIITQGRNIASQRVFQKFGYRSTGIGLWYHKWF